MVSGIENIEHSIIKKGFLTTILTAVVLLFFTGCSPEKKLAKSFVKSRRFGPALVFMPHFIYKYNLKQDIPGLEQLTEDEQDSLLWFRSDFIQYIDDSIFIENFQKGYVEELKVYGIKAYTENQIDEFFSNDSGGFVVNVVQIELEEQYFPYVDEVTIDGQLYSHHHTLNAVDVSSWFEIKTVDHPDTAKVLFAENLLTDDFEGFFEQNPFTGEIQYFYRLDTLTTEKIYTRAYDLGQTYAGYTFDFFLNRYLDKNLPEEQRSNRYLHYDPYTKTIYDAGDDHFEEMENNEENH